MLKHKIHFNLMKIFHNNIIRINNINLNHFLLLIFISKNLLIRVFHSNNYNILINIIPIHSNNFKFKIKNNPNMDLLQSHVNFKS